MNLTTIKHKITPIFLNYGVTSVWLFGSVARGQEKPDSDIDLLIKTKNLPHGIWSFVGLKQDLEQILKKKVDIVSKDALNPKLAKNIKKDLTLIYGANQ